MWGHLFIAPCRMPHLEISPSSVNFSPPLVHVTPQVLNISNTSGNLVTFKIQTTSPTRYAVKPKTGTIRPNGRVLVTIAFNYLRSSSDDTSTFNDRFLVMSKLAEDGVSLTDMWKSKENMSAQKIPVTFNPSSASDRKEDFLTLTNQLAEEIKTVQKQNRLAEDRITKLTAECNKQTSSNTVLSRELSNFQSTEPSSTPVKPQTNQPRDILRIFVVFLIFFFLGTLLI